jgi:hypothetical protein
MRHGESTIGLIGLALVLLAWLVPQDRIGYEVKFGLLGFAIAVICLACVLYLRGLWHDRGKEKALDDLSEAISQAIRDLVNKPRPEPLGMEAFAAALAEDYERWCAEIDRALSNKAFFYTIRSVAFSASWIHSADPNDRASRRGPYASDAESEVGTSA